jgi:C-terminal processing protease CtpA/Prc
MAVDDVPVSGRPLAAVALQLEGQAGTRKRLTLERNGKPATVTATVKSLL